MTAGEDSAAREASGSATAPALRQAPFLVGLLLTTGSTLALEVLDTRLLSVVTWYSLAFFVIAMGLFGLTAGAVRVYLNPNAFTPDRVATSLSRASMAFALAVPISYILLLIVPLRAAPVATTVPLFLFFSAALALPFYPAGIVVAAAVTKTAFPIGRVYAVDLLGAALGAPLVPFALRATDGGTAILMAGIGGALAAVAFARAGRDNRSVKHAVAIAAVLAVGTTANGLSDRGLVPLWIKERPEIYEPVERIYWNSHSRVEVHKAGPAPAMFWGLGSKCQPPVVTQRTLVIDGHAATPLYHAPGGLDQLAFIHCDVTDVASQFRPGGPAAIIGVGGSRDIQAALLEHHSPVVGIELNRALLDILRSPVGAPTRVPSNPNVRLVHDDARSYLARSTERFRLIQASLIDTWAATGAGAHALGENGLYTRQAWRTFLEHLQPDGVFTVSRWTTVETARMVALAVGALLSMGVEHPRQHIALLTAGMVTTLIVTRQPLSSADEQRLKTIARERGFGIFVLPSHPTTADRLEKVLNAHSLEELDHVALLPDLDFRPATDDRPFFFNVLRLRSFWHEMPNVTGGTIEGNLLATRTLVLAFFASLVLVLAAIVGPLWVRARPRHRADRTLVAGFAYFFLIGVSFMLAEIALLQRLSLILGHPIYSLIVVLSSLVAAAGVGSFVSDRLALDRPPYCYVYPVLISAVLAVVALKWDALAPRISAEPTGTRIVFAVVVTGAVGLVLGLAFPAGMRLVRSLHEEETPWLWGLNGVGSVLASSAAIMIALEWGLTVLLLVAATGYLLLLVPVRVFRKAQSRRGATSPA